MNISPLSYFYAISYWIQSMAMLKTPLAYAKIAEMAIFAIMAAIVMANGNVAWL